MHVHPHCICMCIGFYMCVHVALVSHLLLQFICICIYAMLPLHDLINTHLLDRVNTDRDLLRPDPENEDDDVIIIKIHNKSVKENIAVPFFAVSLCPPSCIVYFVVSVTF